MPDRPNLVPLPSLDELYTVEPEAFVAARNHVVKQLKAAGDRETAAAVGRLRRPPVSAWALNQVARRDVTIVDAVLDASAALAEGLASPGDVDLRALQREFRATVEAVVHAALDVVSASGRTAGPGVRQAAQATLQAAAVDDGIAAALRAGVLAEDEPAPGFVLAEGPATDRPATDTAASGDARGRSATSRVDRTSKVAAAPRPKVVGRRTAARTPASVDARGRSATSSDDRTKGATARAADRAADRETARAERELREAEREAERRRRVRLAELRAESTRLDKRADRLAALADQADAAAASARADADAARTEADRVRAALDAAEA